MGELRRTKIGGRQHQNPNWEVPIVSEWEDGGTFSGIYVSSDGSIYTVDELLKTVLEKDKKRKRRFSK